MGLIIPCSRLFRVNVFAVECIHSHQSSWSCFKTITELTRVLLFIRFKITYLNPHVLLWAIVLPVSMKEASQSMDDALHDSSRFWQIPCIDIYNLRTFHLCLDHYHTSYAVVTWKRKWRPVLCSCPENSELLVHSDWGRPFNQTNSQIDICIGNHLFSSAIWNK